MKLSLITTLTGSTLLAIAFAFAPGCTSSDTRDGASGPVALASDAPAEGATVFLRGHTDSAVANRLVVDVIARGTPDLHGAAFRVTWDPEALAFVETQTGTPWSKQVLAMAKEGKVSNTESQLAVAWTEKGETAIDATAETIIGTLVFDAKGAKGTPLAFKTERSQVVDKKGVRLDVAWRGGTIAAR
jgi:hypothetical protein